MSYNYHVSPAVIIAGGDLNNLKHKLGVSRVDLVLKALNEAGFTAHETYGEAGVEVEVYHFGKVSEREGIDGAVSAFRKLLDFTAGNVRDGEYAFTDENEEERHLRVGWGTSIVTS